MCGGKRVLTHRPRLTDSVIPIAGESLDPLGDSEWSTLPKLRSRRCTTIGPSHESQSPYKSHHTHISSQHNIAVFTVPSAQYSVQPMFKERTRRCSLSIGQLTDVAVAMSNECMSVVLEMYLREK
ncbi:hypothetical protein CBL_10716 [Carabus blaptoides fortunei]